MPKAAKKHLTEIDNDQKRYQFYQFLSMYDDTNLKAVLGEISQNGPVGENGDQQTEEESSRRRSKVL